MERKPVSWMVLTLLIASTLVVFNTPLVEAGETIYIRADGSVDPASAPIHRDGDVYTFTGNIYEYIVVERDNIVIDGAGYTLQGPGTGKGIDLSSRRKVTVRNLNVAGFEYGVYLEFSSRNTVSGNNFKNNYYGVYLSFSGGNTISDNNATNNEFGIQLESSSGNTVSGNNATNNYDGIFVWYFSDHNTVSGNTLKNNSDGIYFYKSSGNTVYRNNFLNNTRNAYGYKSNNTWDNGYPSGGNYWSDYVGVDEKSGPNQKNPGKDGIGDTPHVIDAYNLDRYPFVIPLIPFSPTADFNYVFSAPYPPPNWTLTFDASASKPGWNSTAYVPVVNYTWDFGDGDAVTTTSPIVTHGYAASGNYSVTLNATDTQGLWDTTSKTISIPSLAILDFTITFPYGASAVFPGWGAYPEVWRQIRIEVTVGNMGSESENFTVAIYYDGHVMHDYYGNDTQTVTNLAPGKNVTLTFCWDTTGVAPSYPYEISTDVSGVIPWQHGDVTVRRMGDANGDGHCTFRDLYYLGKSWNKAYGNPDYKWESDYVCDGKVDFRDLYHLGKNWNKY